MTLKMINLGLVQFVISLTFVIIENETNKAWQLNALFSR